VNDPRPTPDSDGATPAADAAHDPAGPPSPATDAPAADPAPEAEPVASDPSPAGADASPPAPRARGATLVATVVAFVLGCAIALAAYVAINGGSLRDAGEPQTFGIAKMAVPRGTAKRDGDTLVAQAPANDVLIVAVPSGFRARELSSVAWDAVDVPPGADVRLLFNTDYKPRAVQSRALVVEDGRVQPISLAGDPDWLGRITGLALAVRAPGATIRVRGVTVKSQTASQLVGDRAREWFRFEPWNGTSINAVTGGAQAQTLPLPVPVGIAALIALAALALARRFFPARLPGTLVSIAAGVFVLAWGLLDVRWTVNLARQNAETVGRYGGKDAAGRALAAEDGDLYRFIEKAKGAMPADPQRVVVLSSAHYYRGRAGWHLLPHRALWSPATDAAPARGALRAGDYLVVWQDTHARFDAGSGRLHFDNGVDLPAKLVLADGDGAVYAIL
jgi:hypothetical protein